MLNNKLVCILLIILFSQCRFLFAIKWLALTNSHFNTIWKNENDCLSLDKIFTSQQIKFCRKNPELMPIIKESANQTLHYCEKLFQANRWNCSSLSFVPRLTNDLTQGTREQAFVYALSATSFFYNIARKCASHDSTLKCGCGGFIHRDNDTNAHIINGCNDNVEYALSKGREMFFMAANLKRSTLFNEADRELIKNVTESVLYMNDYNYRVGYQLIKSNIETRCKCHGISASCNLKTCWQKIPEFELIAHRLKEKYQKAIEVKFENVSKTFRSIFGLKLSDNDLVFVKKSPDYCEYDVKTGALGTKGRKCLAATINNHYQSTNSSLSSSTPHLASCSYLCCRRGYFTSNVKFIEYECNCKVIFCCRPVCEICKKKVDENYCL